MYAYIALLVGLLALLVVCLRNVWVERKRRQRAWADYYERPDRRDRRRPPDRSRRR